MGFAAMLADLHVLIFCNAISCRPGGTSLFSFCKYSFSIGLTFELTNINSSTAASTNGACPWANWQAHCGRRTKWKRTCYIDKVLFDFREEKINYEFEKEGLPLYNFEEATEFNMENLRKPVKDDIQAITAVHEAGHAIIAMRTLKILPEYICSTSADTQSTGFMIIKNKWKFFAKEEVVPRIATNMAGWMAEKIIFGPEKITKGAQGDIVTATDYATSAIKEYGIGTLAASINTPESITKYHYHDYTGEHNDEVKTLLQEGVLLAEQILLAEKTLLLELSDYLSDERIIKKEAIEKMVSEFGSAELRNVVFIEDGNHSYYRSRLKMQIAEKNRDVVTQQTVSEQSIISLNKKAV